MAVPNSKHFDDIKKKGFLMKMKTKKRKFFVLRDEVDKSNPARLEYFQDEAKFLAVPGKPRRTILLKNCLEITDGATGNGKTASTSVRGKESSSCSPTGSHVIHIYTKKDAFKVSCSSEEEKEEWLSLLLELKRKCQEDRTLTDQEGFEMSWEVRVMKKSSGSCRKIKPGKYRFRLNSKTITLVGESSSNSRFEFTLDSIRKLGDTKDLFFLELGTSSTIGEGQLWMEVDDPLIASNIHLHVFSLMNEKRPRCQTGVEPRYKKSDTKSRPLKSRTSIPQPVSSTSSKRTSASTGGAPLDVQSDLSYLTGLEDRTASSSSVSSQRSSGSSLPSSANKSQSSIVIPAFPTSRIALPPANEGTLMGEPDRDGFYFPMDGFLKQSDIDIVRTSSVGNKSEYLKNVHMFGHAPRDAEKCSSAPHLQNEAEGYQIEERFNECLGFKDSSYALHKPPPYRKGCFYCESIESTSSSSSRRDFYSEVDFEKPGKGRHSSSGSSKKDICKKPSFISKFCPPKQPIGGKTFRPDPYSNYQHFLHHLFLDSGEQDQFHKRERLPTIDGSTISGRVAACVQLRPRALTGDQKNLAVRNKCRPDNNSGYMSMQGKPSQDQPIRSSGDRKSKGEEEPYLDMTQGLKMTQCSDYLDMHLGKSPPAASSVRSERCAVESARPPTGEFAARSFGSTGSSRSAKTSESDVFVDPNYMDMSFVSTPTTAASGDGGSLFGSASAMSSSSNSSVSSASSQNNFSSTTISNLEATSDYMKMSPCDRLS